MDLQRRIRGHFEDSARLKQEAAEPLAGPIARAVELITSALAADRKLLVCGNGGSAGDSQHLAAELIGRFERERPELAAVALTTDSSILTAIANDYAFEQVFAKQVRGLGREGDVLVAISTSGNSPSVLAAAQAARERGLAIVALTGRGGGRLGEMLGDGDVHLCVPHDRTARIQEVHLLIIHCLCDGIDVSLMGE
ncbi:phosphoheptose isomerase [Burkholderiaceae bacterium FT117]|uniref:phosphoheptose isomerase n=1 Tax=Zeimonas sediminis TaxID=2944268 RepID=UPI002342C96B|nr:phosphoheptose isomerase [Zeimonas sediminis]MCM5570987.1 phosphoheptose isomerase [Zeimonas sediminis]